MASLFIVALFAFVTRAHGAEWSKRWGRDTAQAIYAIAFCAAAYSIHPWLVAFGLLAPLGLALGHGRFYAMNGAKLSDTNPEWIETYLVLPWYKGDITCPIYSWVCMGVKGLIIGLAAPHGLIFALAWPLSYYVSFKFTKDSVFAEYLTGACVGLVLVGSLW